ncbi:MAG: hypothetical protein JSV89_01320 [Spirochaetaceae bacterium]|nr:MAG: hypothetical protein JSV89_01320 [Spirochaetaceae bacterium]
MSTLARKPKRGLKALYILLGIVPWIAINYYWIRIGELKNPTWMIVVNALIAFLAFVGPALDRGFRKLKSRD